MNIVRNVYRAFPSQGRALQPSRTACVCRVSSEGKRTVHTEHDPGQDDSSPFTCFLTFYFSEFNSLFPPAFEYQPFAKTFDAAETVILCEGQDVSLLSNIEWLTAAVASTVPCFFHFPFEPLVHPSPRLRLPNFVYSSLWTTGRIVSSRFWTIYSSTRTRK